MMSGSIVVDGRSGSSTGASMRGGTVVVKGDAGARSAIAGKGGTVVIGGSTGSMSGFMDQRTTLVVCGDAGEAFGDSMYEGVLYCGGAIADVGSDTLVEGPDADELAMLASLTEPHGLGPATRLDEGAVGRAPVALRQARVLGVEGGAVTDRPLPRLVAGDDRRHPARRPSSAAT